MNNCLFCNKEIKNTKKFCCRSCAMKFRWTDAEYKNKMKQLSYSLWKSEEYVNAMISIRNSPEYKDKQSSSTKQSMSSHLTKRKCLDALKNYFSIKENREKHSQTQSSMWTAEKKKHHSEIMLKKWKNAGFANKCFNSGKRYKLYEFYDRSIKIQGYENIVLDDLRKLYNDSDIYAGIEQIADIIKIQYDYENSVHTYWPDIYIKSTNTIIEVKSIFYYEHELNKNLAKAQAAKENGYNFLFAIVNPRNHDIVYKLFNL